MVEDKNMALPSSSTLLKLQICNLKENVRNYDYKQACQIWIFPSTGQLGLLADF